MEILMNECLNEIIKQRIERTRKNLESNNMQTFYAETKEDAVSIVESLLEEGSTVAKGGSMTLKEAGITNLLMSGRYNYLDSTGLSGDEQKNYYRQSFFADAYLCSANAITENGELYNVDGNSNRVAAICYGPESVIIVAGYNKIVSNLDEAIKRVKNIAAPCNTKRLDKKTYCHEKGLCMTCTSDNNEITSGCKSDQRICCNYLVSAQQRIKNRIKVIIINDSLGF